MNKIAITLLLLFAVNLPAMEEKDEDSSEIALDYDEDISLPLVASKKKNNLFNLLKTSLKNFINPHKNNPEQGQQKLRRKLFKAVERGQVIEVQKLVVDNGAYDSVTDEDGLILWQMALDKDWPILAEALKDRASFSNPEIMKKLIDEAMRDVRNTLDVGGFI